MFKAAVFTHAVTDRLTCHLSLAEYCDERVCLPGDHISGTVRPKHLQPLNRSDAVLFVNSGGPKKAARCPGHPGERAVFFGGATMRQYFSTTRCTTARTERRLQDIAGD